MNILGIETSCDETAASVVQNGKTILSNTIVSSLKQHKPFGGIIPEIASRRQLEYINAVVHKAINDASLNLKGIHAIAVTKSPGLIGSLLVGLSFARSLSYALQKPLIEIDHVHAHAYAPFLINKGDKKRLPKLPAVGLVVSGGHTNLYHIKDFLKYQCIGHTIDDAAGEAFDKVARILDLGYPGGPVIDRLAKKVKNPNIQFTCAPLPDTLNFSFSGIKTAVLYYKQKNENHHHYSVNHVISAFQQSVNKVLVSKCISACKQFKSKTLLVGGGVAANSELREKLTNACNEHDIKVHFSPMQLCTDNAAMIAGLGYHYLKNKR